MSSPVYTTGDIAKRLGCQVWQIRRLYERGLLREPARAGAYRVVAESDVPAVEQALRIAGYLPPQLAGAESVHA
jgi:DNA-binding transcriptional MerR regulator